MSGVTYQPVKYKRFAFNDTTRLLNRFSGNNLELLPVSGGSFYYTFLSASWFIPAALTSCWIAYNTNGNGIVSNVIDLATQASFAAFYIDSLGVVQGSGNALYFSCDNKDVLTAPFVLDLYYYVFNYAV